MRQVNRVDWDKLRADIQITDIDEAMLTHADLFIVYANAYTKALAMEADAKFNYERKLAIIRTRLRDSLCLSEGGKSVSEARLDRELPMQMEVQDAKEEWVDAEEIANEWRMAMEVIRIRKDMLVQLSANRREEMAQGIRNTAEHIVPPDAIERVRQAFNKVASDKKEIED